VPAAKPKFKIPPLVISSSPTARLIRSLETRNIEIVEEIWNDCVRMVGPVNSKIRVHFDVLDEMYYGNYDHSTKVVNLNVLISPRNVVKIMLHELTHAKQYHTRRLRDAKINGRWGCYFEGVFHANQNSKRAEYWGAPWEIEARTAEAMADGIINRLDDWATLCRRPYWLIES
jgi:hypothetical protein